MTVEPSSDRRPAPDEQVRILCRTVFGGVVLVDDSRRYVYVNEPAAELLGAPSDVILGQRVDQFAIEDRRDRVELFWRSFKQSGELEGRGPMLRHDGLVVMVEFRAHWSFDPGVHLIALNESGTPAAPSPDGQPLPRLSPREWEVLKLAAEGHSTRDIATALVLSPGTVKTHFQHIYNKLDARDRVSAVVTALRLGLIA